MKCFFNRPTNCRALQVKSLMDIALSIEHVIHYYEIHLFRSHFIPPYKEDFMQTIDAADQGFGVPDNVSIVMRKESMEGMKLRP